MGKLCSLCRSKILSIIGVCDRVNCAKTVDRMGSLSYTIYGIKEKRLYCILAWTCGVQFRKREVYFMATKRQKEHAWENAKPIRGKNPDSWRRDAAGNVIRHGSYGTKGEYGWEVDHKNPRSKGGTEHLRNVQALHWKANRSKGNKYF